MCSLYVPGWMPSARASSLAAFANAFSLLITPLATIVAAMSVAVSPGLTTTSASPEPAPVKSGVVPNLLVSERPPTSAPAPRAAITISVISGEDDPPAAPPAALRLLPAALRPAGPVPGVGLGEEVDLVAVHRPARRHRTARASTRDETVTQCTNITSSSGRHPTTPEV